MLFLTGGMFIVVAVGQNNYDPSFLFSIPRQQKNVHLIPDQSGLNNAFADVISKQISSSAGIYFYISQIFRMHASGT